MTLIDRIKSAFRAGRHEFAKPAKPTAQTVATAEKTTHHPPKEAGRETILFIEPPAAHRPKFLR